MTIAITSTFPRSARVCVSPLSTSSATHTCRMRASAVAQLTLAAVVLREHECPFLCARVSRGERAEEANPDTLSAGNTL